MNDTRNDAAVDVGANDLDYKKAIGADEGGLVDTAVNAIKGVAGKLADKLDPLTEQYAGLSSKPACARPSSASRAITEWISRRRGSRRWTVYSSRHGSSPPPPIAC